MKLAYISLLATALAVAGCKGKEEPVDPAPAVDRVSIMTFNVQNLFDNVDDPGKDDKAYLPIAAKQSEEHIAACNEIEAIVKLTACKLKKAARRRRLFV